MLTLQNGTHEVFRLVVDGPGHLSKLCKLDRQLLADGGDGVAEYLQRFEGGVYGEAGVDEVAREGPSLACPTPRCRSGCCSPVVATASTDCAPGGVRCRNAGRLRRGEQAVGRRA